MRAGAEDDGLEEEGSDQTLKWLFLDEREAVFRYQLLMANKSRPKAEGGGVTDDRRMASLLRGLTATVNLLLSRKKGYEGKEEDEISGALCVPIIDCDRLGPCFGRGRRVEGTEVHENIKGDGVPVEIGK